MEELPFDCDLTSAIHPGGRNILAIRITNPGGRYDWVDGTTIRWGKVSLYRSHGFGGLDRELTLHIAPRAWRIADVWVLNTPEPRTIHAFAKIEGHTTAAPRFELLDPATGKVLATATGEPESGQQTFRATLACPDAHLWDLDTPTLYRLRVILPAANSQHDLRIVPFGFRWFAPDDWAPTPSFVSTAAASKSSPPSPGATGDITDSGPRPSSPSAK